MGHIADRQTLVFSEDHQLLQAIPQSHMEQILDDAIRAIRIVAQRPQVLCHYEDSFLCSGGRYDCPRTLVI